MYKKIRFMDETEKEIEAEERQLAAEALTRSRYETVSEKPTDFYHDMGILRHPKTNKPVLDLTSYQKQAWSDAFYHKYRLIIKSQKIGITTTALMEDFQRAILPSSHPLSCRGKEILIIAQKYEMAKYHLQTLRSMIINSNKYRDYLISSPTEYTLRTEVTKANVLYIYNPDNPKKPTKIIALGPRPSGVWSWKEVKHIHMSDVAAVDQVDDSGLFGAAFSRLANTNGSILIESPPRGQRGKVSVSIVQNVSAKTLMNETVKKEEEASCTLTGGTVTIL